MSTKLGQKIKELRKNEGLSLQALADKVDSSKSYMWELENKPVAQPSALVLTKIASVLRVTTEYLVDDKQEKVPENAGNDAFYRKYSGLNEQTKKMLNEYLEFLEKKI